MNSLLKTFIWSLGTGTACTCTVLASIEFSKKNIEQKDPHETTKKLLNKKPSTKHTVEERIKYVEGLGSGIKSS